LVIDSGSIENLLSTEVMEKLKLKNVPHMNVHRSSWLKRGQHVTVIEQYLLNFQIGKFSEHVLCHIVEMDPCHALLKRPWLFDIKKFHDGRKNTYDFFKDGQRYRLEPMVEIELSGSDNKGNDRKNVCNNSCIMMCSAK